MRIGIMLRSIDEKQGTGIYTRNILKELLKIDRKNEYTLFYRNKENLGRFSEYPNVKERYVYAPSKLLWDQVAIPYIAKKEELDIIFHTKFTLPLLAHCKSIMVLHGSDWFVRPDGYKRYDIVYIRAAMPLYCRKASAIISNSNLTTNDFIKILGIERTKIKTIYFGIDKRFTVIDDVEFLNRVKAKYSLPENFVLYVGRISPQKNFGNLLRAFYKLRKDFPSYRLVAVGHPRYNYQEDFKLIDELGLKEDVIFTGWVEQEDLPVFYNLARLFVFPSLYEGFGIPILEAMACGCPVVSSNTGSLPEIGDNAALFIDPGDVDGISNAMREVLTNSNLRQCLIEMGLKHGKNFSWERCAKETLALFESLNNGIDGQEL